MAKSLQPDLFGEKKTPMYCFDTSALVDFNQRSMPLKVVPDVWAYLSSLTEKGLVLSPMEVYREILKKDDEVSRWIKPRKKGVFREPSTEEQYFLTNNILVDFPNCLRGYESTDLLADPWIVAFAKINSLTVITYETPNGGGSLSKVKIPDMCKQYDIPYMNTLDLIKKTGLIFGRR